MKYYPDTNEPILECGSLYHVGDDVYELTDAKGISCGTVCEECVDEVKAKYRPEIFTNPRYDMPEEDMYESWSNDDYDYQEEA